ncbi:hypothetical protein ACTXT7_013178 [Hymenolepis weldensis]
MDPNNLTSERMIRSLGSVFGSSTSLPSKQRIVNQLFTCFQFGSPKEDQCRHFILTLDFQSPRNAKILLLLLSLLD